MKDRFVQFVIADKTRILTLLVSFALGLTVTIASRIFGIEISEERSAEITLFCTLIFGWLIEAYAAEVNAYGAERVQMALQAVDKSIQVDRYIGPNTIHVTDNVVSQAEAFQQLPPPKKLTPAKPAATAKKKPTAAKKTTPPRKSQTPLERRSSKRK
mgnify:CR=1 FL=1